MDFGDPLVDHVIHFSIDADSGEVIIALQCIYQSLHDPKPCAEAGVFERSHGLAAELEFVDIRFETSFGRLSPWIIDIKDRADEVSKFYQFDIRAPKDDDPALAGFYHNGEGTQSRFGVLTKKSP